MHWLKHWKIAQLGGGITGYECFHLCCWLPLFTSSSHGFLFSILGCLLGVCQYTMLYTCTWNGTSYELIIYEQHGNETRSSWMQLVCSSTNIMIVRPEAWFWKVSLPYQWVALPTRSVVASCSSQDLLIAGILARSSTLERWLPSWECPLWYGRLQIQLQ